MKRIRNEKKRKERMSKKEFNDKLTAENYKAWRFKLTAWLKKEKLWAITTEKSDKKGKKRSVEEDDEDTRAIAAIALNIGDDLIHIVMECETAVDMWLALEQHFYTGNRVNVIGLRQELNRMKYEDGTSLDEYLQKFEDNLMKLRMKGTKIPEKEACETLLASLSDRFDSLVNIISEDEELTLIDTKNRLMAQDTRDRMRGKIRDETESAMTTRGNTRRRPSPRRNHYETGDGARRDERVCYNCGKVGHIQLDCTKERKERRRCYNCNKFGHIAMDCDQRRKERSNIAIKRGSDDEDEKEPTERHYAMSAKVQTTKYKHENEWNGDWKRKATCYRCRATGHISSECRSWERVNRRKQIRNEGANAEGTRQRSNDSRSISPRTNGWNKDWRDREIEKLRIEIQDLKKQTLGRSTTTETHREEENWDNVPYETFVETEEKGKEEKTNEDNDNKIIGKLTREKREQNRSRSASIERVL